MPYYRLLLVVLLLAFSFHLLPTIYGERGEDDNSKTLNSQIGAGENLLHLLSDTRSWTFGQWRSQETKVKYNFPEARVAVVETGTSHDEVLGSILYDLSEMNIKPMLFRSFDFRHSFETLLEEIYPYDWTDAGERSSVLNEYIEENIFDLVILNTCESQYEDVLESLEAAPSTRIACVLHHSLENRDAKNMLNVSNSGQVAMIGLTEQCTRFTADRWQVFADKDGLSELANVGFHTIVPAFPVSGLENQERGHKIPSRLAIQGSIDRGRRDYDRVLNDFITLIKEDPFFWGLVKSQENDSYIPIPTPTADTPPPLQFFLIGEIVSWAAPKIPPELELLVHIKGELSFEDYYHFINSMDFLIPAFQHDGYYYNTASSSIGASLISRTPVLASTRVVWAYSYLKPPAAVLYPAGWSVGKALSYLRSGKDPMHEASESDYLAHWEESSWETYLENVYASNRRVWAKILGYEGA